MPECHSRWVCNVPGSNFMRAHGYLWLWKSRLCTLVNQRNNLSFARCSTAYMQGDSHNAVECSTITYEMIAFSGDVLTEWKMSTREDLFC